MKWLKKLFGTEQITERKEPPRFTHAENYIFEGEVGGERGKEFARLAIAEFKQLYPDRLVDGDSVEVTYTAEGVEPGATGILITYAAREGEEVGFIGKEFGNICRKHGL